MSKHYEFPGGIDILPGKQGEAVTSGGFRLVTIGGVPYSTTDGITFTPVGGGSGTVHVGSGLSGDGSVGTPLITSPTEYYASLTAGAATSLTLSGLNGDADGIYKVRFYIKSVQAANNIKIQVNGADTNLNCVFGDRLHGSVSLSGSWTVARAGLNPQPFGNGDFLTLDGFFNAKSGRKREYNALGYAFLPATGNGFELLGEYTDTTTNLTSISVVGSVATGLSSECFILATRIQSNNPLA